MFRDFKKFSKCTFKKKYIPRNGFKNTGRPPYGESGRRPEIFGILHPKQSRKWCFGRVKMHPDIHKTQKKIACGAHEHVRHNTSSFSWLKSFFVQQILSFKKKVWKVIIRIERGCPENAKNEVFYFRLPAAGEKFWGLYPKQYLRIPPLNVPKNF